MNIRNFSIFVVISVLIMAIVSFSNYMDSEKTLVKSDINFDTTIVSFMLNSQETMVDSLIKIVQQKDNSLTNDDSQNIKDLIVKALRNPSDKTIVDLQAMLIETKVVKDTSDMNSFFPMFFDKMKIIQELYKTCQDKINERNKIILQKRQANAIYDFWYKMEIGLNDEKK